MGKTQGRAAEKLHFRGARPRSVFVSYTRRTEQDRAACQQLLDRLRPLCRSRLLHHNDPWEIWVDHASLKANDDWNEHIQQAMQQASLFIVVMSLGYLNSDFCMHKELPTMLRRRAAEGVPVFGVLVEDVQPEDFVATLADGRSVSLGEVQVLPLGPDGWRSVDEGMRRAWPTADEMPVEDDPVEAPTLALPYWCDRDAQVRQLGRQRGTVLTSRRPLVLVHEAHEDDGPTHWVERLALAEIDKAIPAVNGRDVPGFGTPLYFGWPRDPLDADDALHDLCDRLGRVALGRTAVRKDLQSWQARQPVLWWTQLSATAGETPVRHAADALGLLLTGWPSRARGALLVVVLNVVAARAGEDTAPVKRLLLERLAAAGGSTGGFQLADLGTLGPVTEQDVIDWLNDHRFGAQLRRIGRDPLHLREKVLAGVRMREFVRLFEAWSGRTRD